jgi:hypothetical protein
MPLATHPALAQELHERPGDGLASSVEHNACDRAAARQVDVDRFEHVTRPEIDWPPLLVRALLSVLQRDEAGLRCGEHVLRGGKALELELARCIGRRRRDVGDASCRDPDIDALQRFACVQLHDAATNDSGTRAVAGLHARFRRLRRRRLCERGRSRERHCNDD